MQARVVVYECNYNSFTLTHKFTDEKNHLLMLLAQCISQYHPKTSGISEFSQLQKAKAHGPA
jgi:hypothetical protein